MRRQDLAATRIGARVWQVLERSGLPAEEHRLGNQGDQLAAEMSIKSPWKQAAKLLTEQKCGMATWQELAAVIRLVGGDKAAWTAKHEQTHRALST